MNKIRSRGHTCLDAPGLDVCPITSHSRSPSQPRDSLTSVPDARVDARGLGRSLAGERPGAREPVRDQMWENQEQLTGTAPRRGRHAGPTPHSWHGVTSGPEPPT